MNKRAVRHNGLRTAWCLMLVLCLVSAAAGAPLPVAMKNADFGQEAVFFASAFPAGQSSALASGKRTKANPYDDISKNAATPGEVLSGFDWRPSPYHSETSFDSSPCADRAVDPIRAPPSASSLFDRQ